MPKVNSGVRLIVRERDGFKCRICGVPETKKNRLQLHHIKYRCHGGTNHPDNLMLVCQKCHQHIHEED